MPRYVGIDYSMSSPAMCVWDGDARPEFVNCEVHFLTNMRKCVGFFSNMTGTAMPDWNSPEERFDLISDHFVSLLRESDRVVLEGYAYGAKGQVFEIGECAGILKHKLRRRRITFEVVPPTVIKKHATGKGNADKSALERAFVEGQGFDVRKALSLTERQTNPSSDIIDAFFMCDFCYVKENEAEGS